MEILSLKEKKWKDKEIIKMESEKENGNYKNGKLEKLLEIIKMERAIMKMES